MLSDSTEEYDRGEKLSHYKQIPSAEVIVLVWQTERRWEVWQREGAGWAKSDAERGGSVTLHGTDAPLSVDAIYDAAGA